MRRAPSFEEFARKRLARLEHESGRKFTTAHCDQAIEKAATAPATLTEGDLTVIGFFRDERAETEARADRELARNTPRPPAPTPPAVKPSVSSPWRSRSPRGGSCRRGEGELPDRSAPSLESRTVAGFLGDPT